MIGWVFILMADFMNFPTPRERVLTCGNTTVGVIPDICLVSHFRVDAWQVLYRPVETGNVKRWGLPLMVPNFSRLEDGVFKETGTTLPIHGFGRNLPWTIIEVDDTHLRMQLISSGITIPDYPYEFTFTANIEVGEGTLTFILTMENHGNENMPIAPGFHPYIAVAQSEKANVDTDGPQGFDVHVFDWVQCVPDNPYPFPHQVTIRLPAGGALTIAEIPQAGKYALSNMQVWSEPPTKPDHDFICFEPTVGSEDAINRPADRLNIEPGGSKQIVLQLHVQPM